MPVPKYDECMIPLLEYASDGEIHSIGDARKALADYFGLTDEERKERLPRWPSDSASKSCTLG